MQSDTQRQKNKDEKKGCERMGSSCVLELKVFFTDLDPELGHEKRERERERSVKEIKCDL